MAIEGLLRELGIHDVFQLLDLSRKTGALTVTSTLRDNQGRVFFEKGVVVFASMRNNPNRIGELLVRAGKITPAELQRALELQKEPGGKSTTIGDFLIDMGAITRRELMRHIRFQVEEIIFGLLSWQEGHFSFEERPIDDAPLVARVHITTESILMEGARRIDEWSRMERVIPHAGVVLSLANVADDHPGLLDLLPTEWEVLGEIDGERTLSVIAHRLARSEFDVARIAYGLATTGIIEVREPADPFANAPAAQALAAEAAAVENPEQAVTDARAALARRPDSAAAHVTLSRALRRAGRQPEAAEVLREALRIDAANAELHRELAFAVVRRGEYSAALSGWEQYLRLAPAAPDAPRVRDAMDAALRLQSLLEEFANV